MCLNKIYIKNPKLDPSGIDKPAISVNCGHCSECAKDKSNDWFVRSYFEVFSGEPKDLYLVTLDFDDEHLPIYDLNTQKLVSLYSPPLKLDPLDLPKNLVPCFNNEEMTKFFARIGYHLPHFKYLCVAEYGGFLRRPHHHVFFVFNKSDLMTGAYLSQVIARTWNCGSHYHVSTVSHCKSDPYSMIRYIVPYTTKDFSFDLDQFCKLPNKFRPRILNSGSFGKAPLLDGRITYELIKNVGTVLINGIKYKIPRYYEQYFTYDYQWDSEKKKALRPLNDLGKELAKLKHNRRYVYYYEEFKASRFTPIHLDTNILQVFKDLFPDSPYNGMLWSDIVDDVMSDDEAFKHYCSIKDFIYTEKSLGIKSGNKFAKYRPYKDAFGFYNYRSNDEKWNLDRTLTFDLELPMQACFLFDLYKLSENRKNLFVSQWKDDCERKKRCWNKLKNDPKKLRYLNSKSFDFRKLYRLSYRDFYHLYFSKSSEYV